MQSACWRCAASRCSSPGFGARTRSSTPRRTGACRRCRFILGVIGALLTAFYMTRQVALVFFGSTRAARARPARASPETAGRAVEHERPHESPAVMTIPLVILAVFAIVLGFIGTPAWPWFQSFLNGESVSVDLGTDSTEGRAAPDAAFDAHRFCWDSDWAGGFTAASPCGTATSPTRWRCCSPDIFELLKNKYFIDELYEASVIAFNAWGSRACDWLDCVGMERGGANWSPTR